MREDTKITKVYRFKELSEEAQEKVMEKLYDINVDYDWWENVYEDAATIGVKIKEFDLDRGAYCKGQFTESELDAANAILENHGKDCETYKDAYEFVWDLAATENDYYGQQREESAKEGTDFVLDYDDFDADYECPELLEDFRQAIFEDYRIMLQHGYDYLTSEEAVRETIDANGYEFTEDGKLY